MQTDANQNKRKIGSSVSRKLSLALRSSAIDAVADHVTGSWAPPAESMIRASPLPVSDEDYETAAAMTLNFYQYLRATDRGQVYTSPHFAIGPGRFEVKALRDMSGDAFGIIPLVYLTDLTPGKLVAGFEAIGPDCRDAIIGAMAFAIDIDGRGVTAINETGFKHFIEMLRFLLHDYFVTARQ